MNFKTFLTITLGTACTLLAIGMFVHQIKEYNFKKQEELQTPKFLIKESPVITLEEAQRRVLGYKEVPFKPWSPNDPKPELVYKPPSPEKVDPDEVVCVDNECRWNRIN